VLVDDPRLDHRANRFAHRNVIENWKYFAPNLVSIHAPGNHLTMLKKPHVHALAGLIFGGMPHEVGESAYV